MMRCEAERTKCHIKKGEHVISSRTLNSYEKFLSNNDLLRVHRSHIVNVAHIRAVTAMDEMLFSDDSKGGEPGTERRSDERAESAVEPSVVREIVRALVVPVGLFLQLHQDVVR